MIRDEFQVAGPSGLNTNVGSAEQERMEGNATTTPVEEIRSSQAKGKTPRMKGELDATHSTNNTRNSFRLLNKENEQNFCRQD